MRTFHQSAEITRASRLLKKQRFRFSDLPSGALEL